MPDEKDLIIEEQKKQIEELTALVNELREVINNLKEQLNKNSGNSSKPPSSDGLKKKPVNKNRSLRKKSGKKPGGQNGHSGTHLVVLTAPDVTHQHLHSDCVKCPNCDICMKTACTKEVRYVVDAVAEVNITAHEMISVPECPLCGEAKEGEFPASVKAAVQYGENLEALAVALNTVGAVSINRTHDILSGVFNIPISVGTISNMISRCADKVQPALDNIISELKKSDVVHADETGFRVDGKLGWVHCCSDDSYTYLAMHAKRGYDAISDIDILPHLNGTVVHDCWSPYWKLTHVRHQLCCAHLLRELNGIEENHPEQKWASELKKLLLKMKQAKDRAIMHCKKALCRSTLKRYEKSYDDIIKLAYEENHLPERLQDKCGKQKRGKVLSLIDRLFTHKGEVCLFLSDFSVPFDNNQAERDIRNVKVKIKVSGCFRTAEGAEEYLKIMSYIGTAKKHRVSSYDAIKFAVSGSSLSIFGQGSE